MILFELTPASPRLPLPFTKATASTILEWYKRDCMAHITYIEVLTSLPFEDSYPSIAADFWAAYAQDDLSTLKVLQGKLVALLKVFDNKN